MRRRKARGLDEIAQLPKRTLTGIFVRQYRAFGFIEGVFYCLQSLVIVTT